jgi:hypothetical protein
MRQVRIAGRNRGDDEEYTYEGNPKYSGLTLYYYYYYYY